MANKKSPSIYANLAKTCMDIDDISLGLHICNHGLRSFPEHIDIMISQSNLLMKSYQMSRNIQDLQDSYFIIKNILKIDHDHYKANLLASKICTLSDEFNSAKDYLNIILKRYPNDINIIKRLKRLEETENTQAGLSDKKDKYPNIYKNSPQYTKVIDTIKGGFSSFLKITGVTGAILMGEDGKLVKFKYLPNSNFNNNLLPVLASLYQSTNKFIKLESNPFQYSILSFTMGSFYLLNLDKLLFILITEGNLVKKDFEDYLERYMEKLQ